MTSRLPTYFHVNRRVITLVTFTAVALWCILFFTYAQHQNFINAKLHLVKRTLIKQEQEYQSKRFGYGQLSKALNSDCKICDKREEGKFHLVTTFYPIVYSKWRNIYHAGQGADSDRKVRDRMEEINFVLQGNLNNRLITAVHILADHPYTVFYLLQANFTNKAKLVYHFLNNETTFFDKMKYIQSYLFNLPVIWTNQDILLGRGIEKINSTKLRKNKLAYVLTRRGRKERFCTMRDDCGPGKSYVGSHDTFIFVATRKFSDKELEILNYEIGVYGSENKFIYFLQKTGNYRVLNPCRVIFTYHVHCLSFRKDKPRVNRDGKSGEASFTDRLE